MVTESHSNLCTGWGDVVYSDIKSATAAVKTLAESNFKGQSKLTVTETSTSHISEIVTLCGQACVDSLNVSSLTGGGSTAIDQLVKSLSPFSDDEIADLILRLKTTRSLGTSSTDKTTFAVMTPKLPSFTGDKKEKGGTGYEQWRSQLKALQSDASYSDLLILNAIHQSVKGTAGSLLLSMPENYHSKDVLEKFDLYFGNVLPVDMLINQFHSSFQEPKEDVVQWSCRIQNMLDQIKQKKPSMPRSEFQQLLRSKFWNGLQPGYVKTSTRYRYDTGEEFDEIFAAARNLELECKQTSQSSAAIHKSFVSHQVAAASNTPNTPKILHRLSNMENRLTKIEKGKNSNPNQQHNKISSVFKTCSRCWIKVF